MCGPALVSPRAGLQAIEVLEPCDEMRGFGSRRIENSVVHGFMQSKTRWVLPGQPCVDLCFSLVYIPEWGAFASCLADAIPGQLVQSSGIVRN